MVYFTFRKGMDGDACVVGKATLMSTSPCLRTASDQSDSLVMFIK